jgi:hypothetical protein
MDKILEIACDESGHTGPNLLQPDQNYFAYASINITDIEASNLIHEAKKQYPVQMPELKSRLLMKSENGKKLVSFLLSKVQDRYVVNLNDKLYALCGWFFEYIYEPIYQRSDQLEFLRRKNLHRFVAMYTYLWMTDNDSKAAVVIQQFQQYMRSLDSSTAPFLFDNPLPKIADDGSEHPFESIIRFAYGYRDRIISDNADIERFTPKNGKWTLDLSISSLWSHLNYWGKENIPLKVICDNSKPLFDYARFFEESGKSESIRQAKINNPKESFGWNMSEPIIFADSKSHPAIQIADLIAGATVFIAEKKFPADLNAIYGQIEPHIHPHSILPEASHIDPRNRSSAVNALIVYDLARRAENRDDPWVGLQEMYRLAEIDWASGKFSLT